ncbi:MAG TPA: hypothetical protein VMR21_15610 [Vicinamibacteria bacterium]|nr:hypothetical protein [Vicinamibacteria bacterium]
MRRLVLILFALVVTPVSTSVHAHEGHAHKVMGTVTAVHVAVSHVELKTAGGKTSSFYVTPTTKYFRGSKAVSFRDLAVGTRVVVTTRMEGAKTVATEVKLAAVSKGTKGPAPQPSPHH